MIQEINEIIHRFMDDRGERPDVITLSSDDMEKFLNELSSHPLIDIELNSKDIKYKGIKMVAIEMYDKDNMRI